MSQGYRLKYDELRENDPTQRESEKSGGKAFDETYPEEGHGRSICFVWTDGRRMFLSYSYLVSGEYVPEENSIILTFTTHVFILKGVNLDRLFYNILHQQAKQITCTDARYNLIGETEKFAVNEIILKKTGP